MKLMYLIQCRAVHDEDWKKWGDYSPYRQDITWLKKSNPEKQWRIAVFELRFTSALYE
jgi:hypothetical protein